MEKFQVNIMPEGINVEVDKGTNLLDAANAAGITLKSSCGGQGTCGRCCVKVLEGKVDGGNGNMSKSQREEGYILACTATVEDGDVTVDFPESSRLSEHQVLLDDSLDEVIK